MDNFARNIAIISDNKSVFPDFEFLKKYSYNLEYINISSALYNLEIPSMIFVEIKHLYLHMVNAENTKMPIEAYLNWVKYNRRFEQVVVFSKKENPVLAKKLLDAGAKAYVVLDKNTAKWQKNLLTILDKKIIWGSTPNLIRLYTK